MSDITVFDSNLLIAVVISFAIGAFSMIVYTKIKVPSEGRTRTWNQDVHEAIVSEYSRRLKDFEKTVAELRMKIDIMELRTIQQSTSQPTTTITDTKADHNQKTKSYYTSKTQSEEARTSVVSEPVTSITQPSIPVFEEGNQSGLQNSTIHVLKLLIERPRTSREIQHAIGRTREHTSRLMKKLYELNLVKREDNSRPFIYSVTDAGRIKLDGKLQTINEDAVEPYPHLYTSESQSQPTV
jgi:DNA-binding MarR family transcriptional regulator